ncbi:acyltransferase family protein [Sphingopyxis sp.]|uniref:acyltransferase family protein n=1 Tax=Sphingopyxis sp. TaxID=1908224 RepID=UPI003BAA429C
MSSATDPAKPVEQARHREQWLDVARGLGIILMVHGHIVNGLAAAELLGGNWLYVNFIIYCFHMPMFFVISGITAAHGLERGRWAFLRPKLWTVVYPYFLWSILQLMAKFAVGGAVNHPVGFDDLLAIPWKPVEQFWFLYALALCHLFAAFVPRKLLAPAAAIAFALSFVMSGWSFRAGAHYIPFYAAGLLFSAALLRWRPRTLWLLSWAGLIVLGTIVWNIPDGYTSIPARIAGIFGIVGTFTLAKLAAGRWQDIFVWLGQRSMTIFVLHVFTGAGIRIVLLKLGVTDAVLHYGAGMIAGLGLSVLAHILFERLGLLRWLGLAPLARKRAAA